MFTSKENINLLGSAVANVNNIILTGIIIARFYKYPKVEYWLGIIFLLSLIPLTIMLFNGFETKRELLYFFQLILMIIFIVVEFLLDYLLEIDFRSNQNILIPFLILFYASMGGMIGIASHSGKFWTILTAVTFLLMTAVSLIMHFKKEF